MRRMESNESDNVDVKNEKKGGLRFAIIMVFIVILLIAIVYLSDILLAPIFERQFESPICESDKTILKTGMAVFTAGDGFIYSFWLPIAVITIILLVFREVAIGEHKIYKKIGMVILLFISLVWYGTVFYPPYFVEPTYVTLIIDDSTQTMDIEGKPLLGDPHNRHLHFDEIDYIKYEHGWKDRYYPGCELDRPVQVKYGSVLIHLQGGKIIEVSFGFDDPGVESNHRLAQELSAATDKKLVTHEKDR